MFKRKDNDKAWGVSDPYKRKFLAGFFVGLVVGMALGRLLGAL